MGDNNISGVQNITRLHILIHKYGEIALQTLFLGRYKELTSRKWESESLTCKLSFLTQLCGGLSLSVKQRVIVQTGDICQWDITLLATLVLQMEIHDDGNENATKKHTEENAAIQEIRQLRNQLSHMSGKPMSPSEFTTIWQKAQDVLVYFGISENDIDHVRMTSKLDGIEFNNAFVNPENMARSTSLRGEGNAALQLNRATDAIKIYDKALLLSGLSKSERATLHSNRSQASLKVLQEGGQSIDEANETAQRALEDAKMTIEFRPLWWKGYCRAGQVHKYRKEFAEAIHWFEYAMSLEPGQPSLINARDECRFDLRREEIKEHLDPLHNYVNRQEMTNHIAKTRGLGYTYHGKDETKTCMEVAGHLTKSDVPEMKGHALNYLAHQYKLGDHAPLDNEMAFSLFKQAADVGSPEGIYNVGLMYMHGEGVERDMKMALSYFERVAKCPWSNDGDLLKNLGVAEGKFMIGKCYEDGVGYETNYTKAAEWYQRASLEGLGNASNNLGSVYREGLGVEQSIPRAIQYWRLAAEQTCPIAMHNLSGAYLRIGDLDQAKAWFSRSVDSGYMPALVQQRQFREEVQKRRQELNDLRKTFPTQIAQSQVATYKLLQRIAKNNVPEMSEIKQIAREKLNPQPNWYEKEETPTFERFLACEPEIQKKADDGWKYAQRILLAMQGFCRGAICLLEFPTQMHAYPNQESLRDNILNDFATAIEAAEFIFSFPEPHLDKLRLLVEAALQNGTDKSKRNARVCYFRLVMNSLQKATRFAEVSKQLYPGDSYFYWIHSCLLGFLGKYTEGAQAAQQGIDLFPEDYEHFYNKAVHLRLGSCSDDITAGGSRSRELRKSRRRQDFDAAVQAYEAFLQRAPPDHRKVPESYYAMAVLSIVSRNPERTEDYYQQGLDAEKYLLSCFLPYDSTSKSLVESSRKTFRRLEAESAALGNKTIPFRFENVLEDSPEEIEERRKLQSTNPKRIIITRSHRYSLKSQVRMVEGASSTSGSTRFATTHQAVHVQRAPKKKTFLIDISFDQMDPTKDHVYEDRAISLTIMEDSIFKTFTSIHSVAKDLNDDFQRIYFYNFDCDDPKVVKNLRYGSRIQVKNPYFRMTADRGTGIRVDDPRSVVFVSAGDENSLCRFCWKEGAPSHCSKCLRVKYCSKECQVQDWKLLKHKDICSLKSIDCL